MYTQIRTGKGKFPGCDKKESAGIKKTKMLCIDLTVLYSDF